MDLSSQRGTSEKTLFKYLNTLAEWFIADSFQGNIEERTRARMLASGIIISWCGLLPFVALLELVFIGHPDAQLLALAISLSSVFIWVIGLLSLRFLGSFSFCVHLVVFSGVFCISIAAYFTGGIYSPVLIAIILPPVIASVFSISAERMRLHIRSADTIARLGGDEFVVILDSIDSKDRVQDIARAMVKEISTPLMFGQTELRVGASAGISLYPDDAGDIKGLLDAADKGMYANKQQKRSLAY